MTSFRKLIVLSVSALLLALSSCADKAETPFTKLHQQLDRDSLALNKIEQQYPEKIRTDFHWCDSMLQYVPQESVDAFFDTLNLAQAYLHQFDEMLPIMRHDLSYIRKQLINLQYDIDHHFLNDSLSALYLEEETASADTLHYRVLYFQDRLPKQDKALQSLKKDLRKAASK